MKQDLLLKIAQKGYAVGFGANLNFATFDMISMIPGCITFLSIVVGLLGLVWVEFTAQIISVSILILSIISVYIERFTSDTDKYKNRGKKNTEQLNRLKNLYYTVKKMDETADFSSIEAQFEEIEQEFNKNSEPKQILFSNWVAHYKFFYEKDISWMDEQLKFHCWRDKIPQTAKTCMCFLIFVVIVYYCCSVPLLNHFFKTILYIN